MLRTAAVVAQLFVLLLAGGLPAADTPDKWVVYDGFDGPGRGKHIVLISGDEEYRSEEYLPALGKILAKHHGFKCTVLFAIDPATGTINPTVKDNIPGMDQIRTADLVIIATRFRNLPDEQMQPLVDYLEAGKPIIGLRTATHAFNIPAGRKFAKYDWRSKDWSGGFGRQVLGETWISHHGHHGVEATRGVIASDAKQHPIVRGCDDIFGPTDVYTVTLPLPGDSQPLVLGQVLAGLKPSDAPVAKKNDPMMPVAWTKSYEVAPGKRGKAFCTTMGAGNDFPSEGFRRMVVNAAYWCLGMEDKTPARAKVDIVGPYEPRNYGFGKYLQGMKPADYAMAESGASKPAAAGGFKPLLNGKDLDGWEAKGTAIFKVEDGVLMGTQTDGRGGDLYTKAEYENFELRFTYRVKWPANTGIWFRTQYQFDILKYKKPVAYSGSLYCPGKLFIIINEDESIENRDGWNEGQVYANGDRLILWLNGKKVGEVKDSTAKRGKFGLQVHGGSEFKGMKVELKRIDVRELQPGDEPSEPAKQ